jgi:hypothetical protein
MLMMAAGRQPRRGGLGDGSGDEDQEGRRPDQGQVADAEDPVQERGHQAAEQAKDAERGEHTQAGAEDDRPHPRRGAETGVQADAPVRVADRRSGIPRY